MIVALVSAVMFKFPNIRSQHLQMRECFKIQNCNLFLSPETTTTTTTTSPPKIMWEEFIATPMSENALSHSVCQPYNAQRYRTVTGGYGALRKCYRTVAKHYGSVTEPLWGVMKSLQDVTKELQIVMECYGSVTELLHYITANIDFVHTAQNALVRCMC